MGVVYIYNYLQLQEAATDGPWGWLAGYRSLILQQINEKPRLKNR